MPDSDRFYKGFRGTRWSKAAKCIIDGSAFSRSGEPCHAQAIGDGLCDRYRTYVSEWESFSGRPRPLRDLAKAA
jgi:hypothetical protein